MESHPYLSKKFPIEWSKMTHLNAEPDFEIALQATKDNIEKICSLKDDEINFDSVFDAFDKCDEMLNTVWDRLSNLKGLRNTPEIAEVAKKLYPIVVEMESNTYMNERLWKVIKRAAEKLKHENLDNEQKRLIEIVTMNFKNNGADLSPEDKVKVAEITSQIA